MQSTTMVKIIYWIIQINEQCYIWKMEKVRNRIDLKLLVNNKKHYLNCTSKTKQMPQNIFDKNVVAIHKSKNALRF